ncbi:NACHT domain-containing protein [Actinoplanes philippinensis]|uniref:NACHT domain-containing protein n=1 Tax=Actinoplanes philippinensis TaxID=35752 RepID=UPI0033D146E4
MRKFGGRRFLPAVAGGTTILIFAAFAWTYFTDDSQDPWQAADQRASVGALVLTGIGLLVTVFTVRQSRRPAASEHRRLLDDAAAELAELVSRQWSHEARVRGLAQPAPLRVRWASTGREVAASAADVLGPGWTAGRPTRLKLHGDVTQVAATLRRLPARRLVVIGAPGSGKTSLAVLLVRELLAVREPGEPVPVLLSLSMWRPEEQGLDEWLVEQIGGAYPLLGSEEHFGADAVRRLLGSGRIIPVLDGLDEVARDQVPLAVTRLNNYLSEDRPMVVTCRAAEYQELIGQVGAVLARAAVVELEPVSHAEAAAYLPAGQGEPGRRRWDPVTRHLAEFPDSAVARAFSTPLMVHLARVVYREPDTSPSDLLAFTDRETLEAHLLQGYVPALYADHRTEGAAGQRRYPQVKAERWLAFLAAHLNRTRARELTWWHLVDAVPFGLGRQALAGVLLVGLLVQVLILRDNTEGWALPMTLGLSLVLGPLIGALMGLADGKPSRIRLRPRMFLNGFAVGSGFALCATPLILAVLLLYTPTVDGLISAVGAVAALCLAGGVLTGIIAFLVDGIGTPADVNRPAGSRTSLRQDRTVFLTTMAASIAVIELLVGQAAFTGAVRWMLLTQVSVVLGTVIAFTSGAGSAWLRFGYARAWLAVRGLAPWRVLDFLDDAHDRGILRRVGPAYQFRHARLQACLASRPAVADPVAVTVTAEQPLAAG